MTAYLLTKKSHGGGWITLNRPHALNALNGDMFQGMQEILRDWEADPEVAYVVLQANGKAFCAGGDIKLLFDMAGGGTSKTAANMLIYEFHLNQYIHTYPKPYLSIINGVTMGGGMGISMHGTYRIITENSLLAMPETAIGFFPDVGAAWFLNRCPGKIGLYLALTGHRLSPEDAVYAKLATHYVTESHLQDLIKSIGESGGKDLQEVLDRFHHNPKDASFLETHRSTIDACFSQTSIEDIFLALEYDHSVFATATLAGLQRMCPLSLRETFIHMEHCKDLSIQDVIQSDIRLISKWVEKEESLHEWVEGIRAAVVDKDRNPKWISRPI